MSLKHEKLQYQKRPFIHLLGPEVQHMPEKEKNELRRRTEKILSPLDFTWYNSRHRTIDESAQAVLTAEARKSRDSADSALHLFGGMHSALIHAIFAYCNRKKAEGMTKVFAQSGVDLFLDMHTSGQLSVPADRLPLSLEDVFRDTPNTTELYKYCGDNPDILPDILMPLMTVRSTVSFLVTSYLRRNGEKSADRIAPIAAACGYAQACVQQAMEHAMGRAMDKPTRHFWEDQVLQYTSAVCAAEANDLNDITYIRGKGDYLLCVKSAASHLQTYGVRAYQQASES